MITMLAALAGCTGGQGAREAQVLADLEAQHAALANRVDLLGQSVEELQGFVHDLGGAVASLARRSGTDESSRRKAAELSRRLVDLSGRLAGLELRGASTLKVKVLSGDGSIDSARNLARRLVGKGYAVEQVDFAPSREVRSSVVFYNKGFESAAEELVRALGGGMVIKPLRWSSVYDLIVVTGGQ